jgi:ribonuclease J
MRDCRGALLVISSAQNLDRLVTVYRAAKQTGRTLVTDLYTASLVHAIGRATIPQPGFSNFKVYVPNRQRILVKRSEEFDRIDLIRECRVFPQWLAENRSNLVLLLSSSTIPELIRAGVMVDGTAVWSMWPGYLDEAGGQRLTSALRKAGIPLVVDHASGHASIADLQRLVGALRPASLVPIHTEAGDRYGDYFEHVELHADYEWWEA